MLQFVLLSLAGTPRHICRLQCNILRRFRRAQGSTRLLWSVLLQLLLLFTLRSACWAAQSPCRSTLRAQLPQGRLQAPRWVALSCETGTILPTETFTRWVMLHTIMRRPAMLPATVGAGRIQDSTLRRAPLLQSGFWQIPNDRACSGQVG